MKWIFIAIGGAGGSILRYAMEGWIQRMSSGNFPIGTLSVNVLGCFAIGLLAGFLTGPLLIREELRIGLSVGLLGGFTTFSAFGLESYGLATRGEYFLAGLNMLISCGLGFLAVVIGYQLAVRWYGL